MISLIAAPLHSGHLDVRCPLLKKSGIDTVARKLNLTPGYGRVPYSVFVAILMAYVAPVDALSSISSAVRYMTTMFRQCGHLYLNITIDSGNPETSRVRLSHIGQGAVYSNGSSFTEDAPARFLLWLLPIIEGLRKFPVFEITLVISAVPLILPAMDCC